jgi:hypothetical protein
MTLPASGQIAMNQVYAEIFGSGTGQISLNDAAVRELFGIASPNAISLSDGYGKTYYKYLYNYGTPQQWAWSYASANTVVELWWGNSIGSFANTGQTYIDSGGKRYYKGAFVETIGGVGDYYKIGRGTTP